MPRWDPKVLTSIAVTTACIALSIATSFFAAKTESEVKARVLNQHDDAAISFLKSLGVSPIFVVKQGSSQTLHTDSTSTYLVVDEEGIVRDMAENDSVLSHGGMIKVVMSSGV